MLKINKALLKRGFLFLVLIIGVVCVGLTISPMAIASVKVIEGFEGSYTLFGTGYSVDPPGITTITTNVTEGNRSLYVPLDAVYEWPNAEIGVQFAAPVDVSRYDTLSVDLYIPNSNFGVTCDIDIHDAAGYQRFSSIPIGIGWNKVSVSVSSITRNVTAITGVKLVIPTPPATAGSYFLLDNIVLIENIEVGKTTIEGFEGSYTLFGTGYSVDPPGITTITTNVTEGNRSLYAPLDAVYEWPNAEIGVQFAAPVNVSRYDTLKVDLYIPNSNFGVTCDIDIHDAAGYQRFSSIPIRIGWNKVSVSVVSITRNITAITGVKLVIPTPPATAGSYFLLDNIRGVTTTIEGFEGSYTLFETGYSVNPPGITTITTNVTEGSRSLYAPLDAVYEWANAEIGVQFAAPVNVSRYDTLSVDLYIPNGNFGVTCDIDIHDAAGYQRFYSIPIGTGWNEVSVSVGSITRNVTAITRVKLVIPTPPATAGSYFLLDNIRAGKALTAEVRKQNGITTLFIKGKPHMGLVLWAGPMPPYTDTEALHIYTEDTPPWNENQDPNNALHNLDTYVLSTMYRDRNAHFILRIGTQAPTWWLNAHPGEKMVFNGGSPAPISMAAYASTLWRTDAGNALSNMIEHVRLSKYADRVIGYNIAGGEAGEWAVATSADYPDESTINRDYFRVWLRNKYNNNVAQLRAAWNDTTVTFDNATIPSLTERTRKDNYSFRDPSISRKTIDFYTYWNWLTADTILHFARIVKTKSVGNALAGAFYGYSIGGTKPADTQRNAHAAAQVLLDSPEIDFMAGPLMYNDRLPAGSEIVRTIEDSLRIHNKIWFNEADIRTYPNNTGESIYIPGVQDSLEVMRRAFAWSIIRGNGVWMQTLDATIRDWVHNFYKIASQVPIPNSNRSRVTELAFIMDEDVAFYMTTDNYISIANRLFQMIEAGRCGVPYSIFSMKDLLLGNVPDHKVYIFMDAFHLTTAQRNTLIAKFKRNNAIAVWEYAAGYADDTGLSVSNVTATTGMTVALATQTTGVPSVTITNYSHPITSGLPPNHVIGTKYEKFTADTLVWDQYDTSKSTIGRLFYINDAGVTTLGTLDINGLTGLGLKAMSGWTSIYSCAPSISAELMRGICNYAGIHVYSSTRDFFAVDNNWLMMHTRGSGSRTINLPGNYNVYDLFNNIRQSGTSQIIFTSAAAETRLFYLDPILSYPSDPVPPTLPALRLAVNWNTGFDANSAAGETKAILMGTPVLTTGNGGRFSEGARITDWGDGWTNGLGYNDAKNINPNAGTIEFWFKPEWNGNAALNPPHNHLFHAMDGVNLDHIKITKIDWTGLGANSLVVEVWRNGTMTAGIDWNGIQNWIAGQWHHIVFTWAPNNYRLYADTVEVGSDISGDVPSRPLPTIAVGCYPPSPWMPNGLTAKGTFDKLRIYDYSVSAAEVVTMYGQGE